jgi:hypothetical protein
MDLWGMRASGVTAKTGTMWHIVLTGKRPGFCLRTAAYAEARFAFFEELRGERG